MKSEDIKKYNLPDEPGIYFFKQGTDIIYIGKATSLRDRVRSYFALDLIKTRGPNIVDMVFKADSIEHIKTDSVLEALILEANLIKKYQPHYNSREKDDKSFNYVVITREPYPKVLLVRGKDLDEHFPKKEVKYVFGPYPHGLELREGLKIIRRIFPYRDAKCVPSGKPCFNRQIGLCPGVCTGEISKKDYAKIVRNIRLLFEGRNHVLIRTLTREMKREAKNQAFENAQELKKKIFALTHIRDFSLILAEKKVEHSEDGKKSEPVFSRMEGYDIAHMGGANMGGVMVVLEDSHIKKSDYRLFKIKKQKGVDDIAALKEVLSRRLDHIEWNFPTCIVVDGGLAQKNAAESILTEKGFDIAVVSVVKDDRHKPDRLLGDEALIGKYKKEILLVNSEAHRFAIKYHRKMRSKFLDRS